MRAHPTPGPAVTIRPFRQGDAEDVAVVMHRSVREAALSDYTEEQVRAWAPAPPTAGTVARWAEGGRRMLVAADEDGRVVGWVDWTADGYIDHLFCAPEVVGRGVGSALYEALEREARHAGTPRLTVHASELARRLFSAKGFTTDERREVVRRGVRLHHYAMHKDLDPEEPQQPDAG